jgi:hypothetical protein
MLVLSIKGVKEAHEAFLKKSKVIFTRRKPEPAAKL